MNLITLDTETGGLDAGSDALLTVGIIASIGDEVVETLYIEIRQETYNVGTEALSINKINLMEHNKTALPRKEAAAVITEFIQKIYGDRKPTVLGHNVGFDIGFLNELFFSTQIPIPYGHRCMDTTSNALFLKYLGYETGSGLSALMQYYGIVYTEDILHNALVDARLTREVFLAQVKHLQGLIGGIA